MSPDVYAQAIYALQSQGKNVDEIVNGMKYSLKKRGALGLVPKILSAYQRLVAKKQSNGAKLTVARGADIDDALKALGISKEDVSINTDERLIGGYRYEADGILQDASFKAKLLQIYRNATKA